MDQQQVKNQFKTMGRAYRQLVAGSETLLEMDRLVWTEKLLLKIVRRLYRARLSQLGEILPGEAD